MNFNHYFIANMSDNTIVSGLYIIEDVRNSLTRLGNPYLNASLCDASGTIRMVCWDYDGDICSKDNGDIVAVTGRVTLYQDRPQLQVEQISRACPDAIDESVLSALVRTADIDFDECAYFVWKMAHGIQDPQIRALCTQLLEAHWDMFTEIPAAKKVHHAFRYGLLMHTADMLVLANTIADHHRAHINRDLLICGVILHDIGKTVEFEISPVTGLVKGYTPAGNLLGHSYIAAAEVAKTAELLGTDPQISLLIQHMLLAHHGNPASGAAKSPMIIEAEILHDLDMLDSRREIYVESLRNVSPGNYSSHIPALDHAAYQHGMLNHQNPAQETTTESSENSPGTTYDPFEEDARYEEASCDIERWICEMEFEAEFSNM